MNTRTRGSWLALVPVLPLTLFFVVFLVGPWAILALTSAFTDTALENLGAAQYAKFFGDLFNWRILGDTLWLGLQVTVVTLLLGYPLAFLYTRIGATARTLLMFAIVMPLLTSAVVRTFAWIVVLGREGIVNNVVTDLGLTGQPLQLLYTNFGVVLALVQIQLPLLVLPLVNSMMKIDPRLLEASQALSAGSWRTFFHVVLPLSLPGAIAGAMLVFSASITAFITQSLIGGGRLIYMPLYIYQQAVALQNWPFAAAVSVIFLFTVLAAVYAFNQLGNMTRRFAHG